MRWRFGYLVLFSFHHLRGSFMDSFGCARYSSSSSVEETWASEILPKSSVLVVTATCEWMSYARTPTCWVLKGTYVHCPHLIHCLHRVWVGPVCDLVFVLTNPLLMNYVFGSVYPLGLLVVCLNVLEFQPRIKHLAEQGQITWGLDVEYSMYP